jgi:LysR family glycine cleavage system transcriptional activator
MTYRPYRAPSRFAGTAAIAARELLAQPLIRSRDNHVSWEAWFARRGIGFEPWAVNHLQIDPSYVAIEAAVNGAGVILESSILTQEHVQNGRLVAPVTARECPSISYWPMPLRPGAGRPTHMACAWMHGQGNCTR